MSHIIHTTREILSTDHGRCAEELGFSDGLSVSAHSNDMSVVARLFPDTVRYLAGARSNINSAASIPQPPSKSTRYVSDFTHPIDTYTVNICSPVRRVDTTSLW